MKLLIDVPGVIRLIDFFFSPSKFHVVQEWAQGGDVFDELAKRTTYTENDARDLSFVLLQTLQHMHSRGLVHRDLKPENLLLLNNFDVSNIKLCDFGFAKKVPEEGLQTRCGTPAFVALEILVGARYKQPVDMWSFGVILYILLGGYPPFQDASHRGLFRKIRASDYVFHEAHWVKVSIEAKQLIASLLTVNADFRTTADGALESKWLNMDQQSLTQHDLSSSALLELRQFNARRKLKSAMHAVTWAVKAQFFNPDAVTFNQQLDDWDLSFEKKQDKPLLKIKFGDVYSLKNKICKGSSATVWECQHKKSGELFAVKIIKREGLKASDDEAVMNEVAVVQSLDHPHIVRFVNFYEEPDYFFLVMELMAGGDVFDRIVKKTHYTELDARDLIKTLLKAVEYMHSRGVAHRDLKPQNLLLTSKEDDADIKLCDFGFSRRVHTPQSLVTRCGTPTYVSPEILKNVPHDQSTDMWSIGVILYVLLVGYPPFMEDSQQELFRKIRAGEYNFPEENWKHISNEAKDLIRKLLKVDPLERLTAGGALRQPWIMETEDSLSSHDLTDGLNALRQRRGRLKNITKAVMWFSRDRSEPIAVNGNGGEGNVEGVDNTTGTV